MHKISLASLRAVAGHRPAGYYKSVIALGRVENDVLFLEDPVYAELRNKYAPPVSLSQKAANLTGAAFRVAAATMKGAKVIAAASEIDRRMAICRGCEHFRDKPVQHCVKCGCALNLKTRLETEHCPIQKW